MAEGFWVAGQGGGCASAYHAGVIKALNERFGFERLDGVAGNSGLSLNWAYVLSGQPHLPIPIWEHLFRSGRFITPLRHPTGRGIMDIDFLVDEIISQAKFAIDLDTFYENRAEFRSGVTHAVTGKSVFLRKKSRAGFCELIRASATVPYFTKGGPGKIHDQPYYDGTIGSVLGLEEVRDRENILIVLTRPLRPIARLVPARKVLRWLLLRNESLKLQEAIWSMPARFNSALEEIRCMYKAKNIAVICPKHKLPIRRLDWSMSRLQVTIEQGYWDTMNHKGIDAFFARLS